MAEGDFIIDDAEAFKFIIGDGGAFQTVVKPPSDDSVVIFEESDERVLVEGAKFEVYEDDAGKYRFRLRAAEGGIVAVGEPYKHDGRSERIVCRCSTCRCERDRCRGRQLESNGRVARRMIGVGQAEIAGVEPV